MIHGAILDYGSTLITFDGDVAEVRGRAHRAMLERLRREGLPLREASFLNRFARKFDEYDRKRNADHREPTAFAVLAAVLEAEGHPAQPADRIRRALRAMYEVYESHWKLFPDTLPALERIRASGLRLAMLSNASDEENVRTMLEGHGLKSFFDPVVISAAIGIRKPDPRAFWPILAAWKIPASELVMVGDQLGKDVRGGLGLGMRTIWLTTEKDSSTNKPLRRKVVPDAQVKTIGEAAALLVHWRGQA
ncbi:MAG: HAD family hydrolase [Anaerolineales bacterium]|nr:HAD family hydrolase [Anaerolineales bacterium]